MGRASRIPLMTAWANDTSYENIFVEQMLNFLEPDDIVLGISCSGNSPNVLRAVEVAREHGAITVGFAGRGGGKLGELVDRGAMAMDRGRYALTAGGLCMCLPGRASGEVARCNVIIDELKTMYRSDPERLWPMSELAHRVGQRTPDTARAVTFLSANLLFHGINWNANSGFVESFTLAELVLDAEHIA